MNRHNISSARIMISRIYADHDPDITKQTQPTPGADNGASGVAVLLELARTLPANTPPIWLVFFDAEDNGKIPGWDWTLGSKAFVATMTVKPQAMLLVDMIGGENPTFYMDGNSDFKFAHIHLGHGCKIGIQGFFYSKRQIRYPGRSHSFHPSRYSVCGHHRH